MTNHQDKGWGVSLPPLLFSLNLVETKVIYEEIYPFIQKKKKKTQPCYQMKDGLCLGALRIAQQARVEINGLRKVLP